ncbi:MAG: hypothetical protein GY851_10545 [bacterium]|nr:hypothetical protein [bacterium]
MPPKTPKRIADEAADFAAQEPRRGTRVPNVPGRDAKLFCHMLPELKDRLDLAVLKERIGRRPEVFDMGVLIDEAVRPWLEEHGY